MSKLMIGIGWILMELGISCADSECLIIPIAMAGTGALMMYAGSKKY